MEGEAVLRLGKEQTDLREGDTAVIPPGISHQVVISAPCRRFVLWMSVEYLNKLLSLSPDLGVLIKTAGEQGGAVVHPDRASFLRIISRLTDMQEELESSRFGRDVEVLLLAGECLLELNRAACERESREKDTLYGKILVYIDDHLFEGLSLEKLSEVFFVSRYYISHLFKENMGLSVHRYILKKRLSLCREAILSGENITRVYLSFGFLDYSAFYRAFKKEYGLSPREFKSRYGSPENPVANPSKE